jgi:FMN hydrolase / 5-amino-6-(5-phospho-D-ribitylamino)uracil phosphatase
MGVVSFDLDGTLWDFAPMMDGAIAAAIDSLERREPALAGRLTVATLHEERRLTGLEHDGTLEDLRRISLHRALIQLGRDDRELADWMADELLQARADVVVLHDDVEPAVHRLIEDGHLVGAITNGNFPFDRLALAAHFSFIVHAEHAGGPKPGPEPFAEAVRLTGGDPANWVHVGDELPLDIGGAHAFGMRAVWLNRYGEERSDEYVPDAEIESLEELPAVVARLIA